MPKGKIKPLSKIMLGKGLNSLIAPGSGEEKKPVAPVPSALQPVSHPTPISHGREEKDFHQYEPRPKRTEHPKPDSVFHIEIEKIRPNPYQPRKHFSEADINELAESIKEFGVLQPIVVTKVVTQNSHGTNVEYQLVAGERRLRAAQVAGIPRIPAIVRRVDGPKMKLELALIENIQRSNLNPMESARAYARFQDEFGLTQREIALRVGKSRESVANTMRLLNLPSNIQIALEEGKVNESQARALLSTENHAEQQMIFERILRGEVGSARRVRESSGVKPGKDPETNYWEKRLEERMGLPVEIAKRGTRGRVSIQFYSDEEFRSILKNFGAELE
jgi:ParB family chromosome partitioning protein